jgi:type 1 glutamine amidotransferase
MLQRYLIPLLLFIACIGNTIMAADSYGVDKLVEIELKKTVFLESAKTKILLMASKPDHPYLSHMYLHECCLLAKCLRQNEGVDAVVNTGWPENADLLSKADSIVIYGRPVADHFLNDENACKKLQQHVKAGKGVVGLHWATGYLHEGNKERGQLWLDSLGCIYDKSQSNVIIDYSKVIRLVKDHPVSNGWLDFLAYDEYYLNMKIVKDAVPVVKVEIADGKEDIVAWCYQRQDGGRSYANTLGHYHYNFANPSFLKMYLNGILWTAKYEIPKNGAKCQISAEDMNLLPEPKNYIEQ